ncbi:MAG: REP-associated tyrosine transposase [Thermomicrobiales bacterium]|nr:REP-associated tyrosine transposase [Thermomicrobiales bacterium]
MPYWRMFCHLIWTTQHREPLLVGNVARVVEASLRKTCEEMRVLVHAIYLMPDHVHMAVSIPPSLSVAQVLSRVKGSSSHLVNHAESASNEAFAWQPEYGAVSFGEKQLPDVVAYIEHQPERHASRQLWDRVERISDEL